ncbi:protein HGH1 homolog [Arctopsyche grandis]|uniref:protein HGH1 homolog n=1 Tax=Arctopsyche grandis TaxID=121162 RepID=UPI00406D813F
MEDLKEMYGFLSINSRMDVKSMALQYILGLSGNVEGVKLLTQCPEILEQIILLLDDETIIKQDALLCMINLTAEAVGVESLIRFESAKLNFSKSGEQTLITRLVNILLSRFDNDSDAACMLLCNLSRSEAHLNECVKSIAPHLLQIMEAFTNTRHSRVGAKYHYIGPLFSNLSAHRQIRDWFCNDELSQGGATKIVSFCRFEESAVRRGGAVGTVRNLCFDVDLHNWLLGPKVDILTYLLYPLAGGEEYEDDEMVTLPPTLQYLPQDKQREADPDIRRMLLESLNKLCVKKFGREFLRDNGTYFILRELHKWEKDRKVLLACENVIDILIRKEHEMTVEDMSTVDVPEEYYEKFSKMDDDFLSSL